MKVKALLRIAEKVPNNHLVLFVDSDAYFSLRNSLRLSIPQILEKHAPNMALQCGKRNNRTFVVSIEDASFPWGKQKEGIYMGCQI